ncbi:MAG TPA: hypothetical protein VG889_12910 [Rhizomicrobium sp.]|nr:hypothetical protein [Rhizomicrobium sp.]
MAANDDLLSSDTILIASFKATLHAPGTEAPLSQSGLCLTKKPGSLHLDLPIAAVPGLVLHADGAFEGAQVVFKIDHDLDVSYEGHKISHVKGSIRMGVAAQAPKPGTACQGGAARRFTVALTPVPGASKLELKVPIFIGSVTATVADIAVTGSAGIV